MSINEYNPTLQTGECGAHTWFLKGAGSVLSATESDVSSVTALTPVLQTTNMRDAFNFPLKCSVRTEGRAARVCVSVAGVVTELHKAVQSSL